MNTSIHSRKLSFLVAILILLAGVFLGGYLVLKSGRVSAGQLDDILKGSSLDLAACQPDARDANKDSDRDGLKDWQEIQIYQSDPCKTDSDSDGYLDGEEAASGYDPTKKAPGDELPGTAPKTPRPLPNNLTAALQQKLSEQLRQDKISPLDANGNLLSSSELEKFPGIQAAVWEITQHRDQIFAPESIAPDEVKTTSDNSLPAIRAYAKKISDNLYQETGKFSSEIEAQVFLNAIQNNDFLEIETRLKSYQQSYQNLKSLAVPSDFVASHIQMLNILSSLEKAYQAIINIEADPLKANLALQQYEILIDQTIRWAQNFEIAIKNHR